MVCRLVRAGGVPSDFQSIQFLQSLHAVPDFAPKNNRVAACRGKRHMSYSKYFLQKLFLQNLMDMGSLFR